MTSGAEMWPGKVSKKQQIRGDVTRVTITSDQGNYSTTNYSTLVLYISKHIYLMVTADYTCSIKSSGKCTQNAGNLHLEFKQNCSF